MLISKTTPIIVSKKASMLQSAIRGYKKSLNAYTISRKIIATEYAVRGAVPLRGEEIKNQLKHGEGSFNFSRVTPCNIVNPQAVGQGHITFNREVISAMINPALLDTEAISLDAKDRAN